MSGTFNLPPRQPKYVFVWNVQAVIKFIKYHWRSTDTLSDRETSQKVCMLLALIVSSRASNRHQIYGQHW